MALAECTPKQRFLSFLKEIGYQKTWMYEALDFLLDDPNDCEDFFEKFWDGNINLMFMTVRKFKKYLLSKRKMSFDQFSNTYALDPVKALERLFQHRVSDHMLECLSKKGLTLNQVYQFTVKNQGCSLYNLVL